MAKKQLTDAMKVVITSMVALLKDGKSDEEILTASKTDKIGEDDCTDELVTALLGLAKSQIESEAAATAAAEKKAKADAEKKAKEEAAAAAAEEAAAIDFHGNQDTEKKHPKFPKSWENSVIARISQSVKLSPKDIDTIEVPSSVEYRPFEKSLFDTHVKQGMFNKMNVEVIHDPR